MKKISNKEEFEQFYPYENKTSIKKYPKEYPCICDWENEGGGLMGEYKQMYVLYYPKNISTIEQAFELGVAKKFEKL